MPKIIVAAPPITGELAPLLELARGLAHRGHQVTVLTVLTVLTGSRFRADVESKGLAFSPLTGGADFDDREFGNNPERESLTPGPEQLNFDWEHAFINPLPDQHAALQALLEQDPDQYLVCNALFLGAVPTALGAPGRKPRRWVAVSEEGALEAAMRCGTGRGYGGPRAARHPVAAGWPGPWPGPTASGTRSSPSTATRSCSA
ncbi:MAG: hypothetical protein ACJ736_08130 [Streptomyces sp.]